MSKSSWLDLGKQLIGEGLPLLGSIVLGKPGEALGGLLGSVLGCEPDDPKAMAKAISENPQLVLELRKAEFKNKEKLQEVSMLIEKNKLVADTARIESVNSTMRVESTAKGLAGLWRPIWGIVSALAFMTLVVAIAIKLFTDPAELPSVLTALASMEWFWAIPLSILGVASWHRGKEKRIAAGERTSSLTDLVTSIKGGKQNA